MTTLRWAAPTCSAGQVNTQQMAAGIVPAGVANGCGANGGFQVQDCSSSICYVLLIAAAGVMYVTHALVSKKGR